MSVPFWKFWGEQRGRAGRYSQPAKAIGFRVKSSCDRPSQNGPGVLPATVSVGIGRNGCHNGIITTAALAE
jgi:hypothetical protein